MSVTGKIGERWNTGYSELSSNAPAVPNPAVWAYAREMEGIQPADFTIPSKDFSVPDPPR